jgi:hypothetical protein
MSWGILLVAVLVLMLATASLADAAAGTFVPQFSPAALPGVATLSVNGDSVPGLSVLLRPPKEPVRWRTADDAFIFQAPPPAGGFSYRGNATSAYFGRHRRPIWRPVFDLRRRQPGAHAGNRNRLAFRRS